MQIKNISDEECRAQKANHITWVGFFTNLILTVFKLIAA